MNDTNIKNNLSNIEELIPELKIIKNINKDVYTLITLFQALIEERKKTNEILQKIYEKIPPQPTKVKTLSEIDQKILNIIKEKGGSCDAEEIKKILGYKNKNAASQRLNNLFEKNLLKKAQSGRKIIYFIAGA